MRKDHLTQIKGEATKLPAGGRLSGDILSSENDKTKAASSAITDYWFAHCA